MQPLIKGFKSTNVWYAFLLNSIATTIIVVFAITLQNVFDIIYIDNNNKKHKLKKQFNWISFVITIITTFFTTFSAYIVMYVLFGFGGGMLINEQNVDNIN